MPEPEEGINNSDVHNDFDAINSSRPGSVTETTQNDQCISRRSSLGANIRNQSAGGPCYCPLLSINQNV